MGSPFSPYILALLSLFLFVSTMPAEPADSAGPNLQDLAQHAGYISLPNTTYADARMFYFFFESRNNKANDPVILWVAGGPGVCSELALFYENGPYHLADNSSLVPNDYSWHKEVSMIYVDQPFGTGFSFISQDTDIRNTSELVADDLHIFLQEFFTQHDEYRKNDFYICGAGYAARYIPNVAIQILKGNKIKQGHNINLKGILIQSAWMNPYIQTKAYPAYALMMNLINQSQYNDCTEPFEWCAQQVRTFCDGKEYNFTACAETNLVCNDILWEYIITPMGDKNYYDISQKCSNTNLSTCYDFSNIESFLNQLSVKKALGVVDDKPFNLRSSAVDTAMSGDVMRRSTGAIPELLEGGIKFLAYAGEHDLICNWLGIVQSLEEMKWSGQEDFLSATNVTFKVNGMDAGWLKISGKLTFLTVSDAGHMVPMYQPKVVLEMLTKWIHDISL